MILKATLYIMLVLAGTSVVTAGVTGREITYACDSTTMKGYIAWNDSIKGKHPAILVVHEWWGNNDYSRKRADMLAALGYVALAVDMYGNGATADNPTDAGALSGSVMKNPKVLNARFMAALDYLRSNPNVDPARIGAIGYCFGGGVVLAMSRAGADLKSVVCFHGSVAAQKPVAKGEVKAKILVCNGGADKFVPEKDISAFKAEMKSAGVPYKFVNYPGALHAFTNPAATSLGKKFNLPIAYNAKADRESWAEMKRWFDRTLVK